MQEKKSRDVADEPKEFRQMDRDFDVVRLPWPLEIEQTIIQEEKANPSMWVKQCLVTPFGIEIGELYYRFSGYENHLNTMVIVDRKHDGITIYDIYGRILHHNLYVSQRFFGP